MTSRNSPNYNDHKRRMAERSRAKARDGKDIGDIPPVFDGERKARARRSFRAFCEAYFPLKFYMGWSADHLQAIARIEKAVNNGGLFAFAMPRGGGKSTLSEAGVLWAALNGKRQFIYLIGNSAEHATDVLLSNIKTELEHNDLLLADYPEALYPVRCLEGETRRCAGQLHHGQRTRISWSADQIILPTIPGSKAAGVIIRVAGLTGNIRGALHTRDDGSSVRPDLVLLDDPQTDQSARSPSECAKREAIINGAILNLAGPGKKIAAVMPCTVIRKGDMADSMLDRDKHPEWQGARSQLVIDFPTNDELWQKYRQIRDDELKADGDGSQATAFYVKNRKKMDAGSRVSWEERFNPDEVSAIQHAMNLKYRNEQAFFAEYQNDPMPDEGESGDRLTPDDVTSKTNGLKRRTIPKEATHTVGYIDVQGRLLYYVVAAFRQDFTGWIIDSGSFPEQKRNYFTYASAGATLGRKFPGAGREGAMQQGIESLCNQLTRRAWPVAGGGSASMDLLLVDSGYEPSLINAALRKMPGSIVMPTKGMGIKAGNKPMSAYQRRPGERMGHHWYVPNVSNTRESRHVLIDTNYWKAFLHSRFMTTPGDAGSLTLWGSDRQTHQMLADHVADSETWTITEGHGRKVQEFKHKPNKPDNHLLDCAAGACVAASMVGCVLLGQGEGVTVNAKTQPLQVKF